MICPNCGTEFEGDRITQRFCSEKCRLDAYYNKGTCSVCGKFGIWKLKDKENKIICRICYSNTIKEICSVCGKEKTHNFKKSLQDLICSNCLREYKKENCSICGIE